MRRSLVVVLGVVLGLSACGSSKERELARYYDPAGLFSTSLPAANTLSVTPPQPGEGGPSLLSGVVSQPPQPSPSPQAQFGGIGSGLAASAAPTDQTVYQAFAVSTDLFDDLSEMALFFLTRDPAIDLRQERSLTLAGAPGSLVVADVVEEGEVRAGLAVAMSLGAGGTGFLLAAVFPPGEWEAEESDFLRIVDSFRAEVPPVLRTYPLTEQTA